MAKPAARLQNGFRMERLLDQAMLPSKAADHKFGPSFQWPPEP
jgi:hypothetical protein